MGMEKAIVSLVVGAAGVAAQFGFEIASGIVDTIAVVLTTLAVYLIPNSK